MFYWFVYDGLKHQIRNCIVRWECSKFHSPSCQAAKMENTLTEATFHGGYIASGYVELDADELARETMLHNIEHEEPLVPIMGGAPAAPVPSSEVFDPNAFISDNINGTAEINEFCIEAFAEKLKEGGGGEGARRGQS